VRGRAFGHVLEHSEDVVIHDVSLGGFLIESPTSFRLNVLHQFRVAAHDGKWKTMLTAISMHRRAKTADDGKTTYLVGFAFIEPIGEDALKCLKILVGHHTSVISY
jgi:hypothetical protein